MKKIMPFLITLLIPFLFTACSLVSVNSLSAEKKFEIYHSVVNEIESYKKEGDIYLKNKYYHKAILAYEKVNFYEAKEVYSKEYINNLKNRASYNAKYFLKKAHENAKKNKIKSLYYINLTMRNNPTLKEAIELKETLLEDAKIKSFINKKEQKVQNLLNKNKMMVYHTRSLNNSVKKLIKYDDFNPIAIKAKSIIKNSYERLVKNSISLYNKKNYSQAKKEFNLLSFIYQEDKTINNYLHYIKQKELIEEAKSHLANKNYNKASKVAKEVLKINQNNQEAKEIISASKVAKCDMTGTLEAKGINLYIKQNFDEAKITFEKIIACHPENRRAHAYLKKINQQLNTIKKLR